MGIAPDRVGVDLDAGPLGLPFPQGDDDVLAGRRRAGWPARPGRRPDRRPGPADRPTGTPRSGASRSRSAGRSAAGTRRSSRMRQADAGVGQHPPGPVEDAAPGCLHRHDPQPVGLGPGGVGRPLRHLEVHEPGQQREEAADAEEPRHDHAPAPHPPRRRDPSPACSGPRVRGDARRPSPPARAGRRQRRPRPRASRNRPGRGQGSGHPADRRRGHRPLPANRPAATPERHSRGTVDAPGRRATGASPEDVPDEGVGQRRRPQRRGDEQIGAQAGREPEGRPGPGPARPRRPPPPPPAARRAPGP